MAEFNKFNIEEYFEIIWYRKWLAIIPMVVLVLATAIGSQFMPDVYRAQTLILVEPQKIPEEFVRSTISVDLERRISTVREQILSRTRLENIIHTFSLYSELVAVMPMEDVVEIMRNNIKVIVQGRDSFRIMFMGHDPYIVQKVTEKLTLSFIEESLMDREKQATSTLSFLDGELERIKKLLEEQEQKVRQFKQQHLGELPEQQDGNQRKLDRLQEQLQIHSVELAEAENRKIILQSALAELSSSSITQGGSGDVVSIDRQIERLEASLANLRLKYTDAHPDVKKVLSDLEGLKKKRAGEVSQGNGDNYQVTSQNRELVSQLKKINLDINTLRLERSRTRAEISTYQRRVELSPKIESELQILTRDYEKSEEEYNEMLKKKQEALRAANLEIEQKGEQFKIIDHARLPISPYSPKRMRLVLLSMMLGLGVGLGAVFTAEHFDHSFRNAEDLEDTTQISVLAAVPMFTLNAPGQTKRMIKLLTLSGAAFIAFCVLILTILYLRYGISPFEFFIG